MSAKATFWAWDIRDISSSEKLVILCLSDCHNADSGQCNPSAESIAEKTGLNIKTIRSARKSLAEKGYISFAQVKQNSITYTLNTTTESGSTESGGTENRVVPKLVAGGTENGRGVVPKLVPEPIIEPKKNLKQDKPATPACPHLEIINLYNETLPELKGVLPSLWDGARKNNLQARWKQSPKHQSLDFWKAYFTELRNHSFYMGENDRGWSADLGWLVKAENFIKMVELFHNGAKR